MKDILIRALKTFIQGFLASLVVIMPQSTDLGLWKSALIGALSGGISAVMNLTVTLLQDKEEK